LIEGGGGPGGCGAVGGGDKQGIPASEPTNQFNEHANLSQLGCPDPLERVNEVSELLRFLRAVSASVCVCVCAKLTSRGGQVWSCLTEALGDASLIQSFVGRVLLRLFVVPPCWGFVVGGHAWRRFSPRSLYRQVSRWISDTLLCLALVSRSVSVCAAG